LNSLKMNFAADVNADVGLLSASTSSPSRDDENFVLDGSYGQAALRHMTRFCETTEAATRLLGDHQVLSLLASTAVPGAEYLLVLRTERSLLMLAGAPEASEQLDEALASSTVDSQIYHVRLNTNKVTVAGINEVRAACLADIDWRLHLETIRHANAADKPLRVVRRAGHPVASGVIARRVGHGPDLDRRLVGQLSVPDALTVLDRSRAWHLITTAAAEDVGRPVRPSDDITVNEMPASRWLADLTCNAGAHLAQWITAS
jgi:hypothetical protein